MPVDAVRTRNATDPSGDVRDYWHADERARRAVTAAVTTYGASAAQIASAAGVRQLGIVELIDDDAATDEALVQARHDAERYLREVMDRIRSTALARHYAGEQKIRICERLGITRPALDAWIRESEMEAPSSV